MADPALAAAGAHRVAFAERAMPVLRRLRQRYAHDRPFAGLRIAACMHVTPETAVLVRTLRAGGATVALAASNPLSTQDDVAAVLAAQDGVFVQARHGADATAYARHLELALQTRPQLILDDACGLLDLLHTRRTDLLDGVRGAGEETTTGVLRLRQMAADGVLRLPVVAVNDTPVQRLVANRHGTGQSTVDAVMGASGTLLAGATVVVAGYGWCGSGIAARCRGLGAQVVVTEVDPVRALAAALDGHRVLPMVEAAGLADVVLTATGVRDVVTADHLPLLRDGVVLANAGHFDVEIDVGALERIAVQVHRQVRPLVDAYELPGGRQALLVAEGRLVNLAAGDGHPAPVMDVSFGLQALVLEHLATTDLPVAVHEVPADLDAEVARAALAGVGARLDQLSGAQIRYLSTWRPAGQLDTKM